MEFVIDYELKQVDKVPKTKNQGAITERETEMVMSMIWQFMHANMECAELCAIKTDDQKSIHSKMQSKFHRIVKKMGLGSELCIKVREIGTDEVKVYLVRK